MIATCSVLAVCVVLWMCLQFVVLFSLFTEDTNDTISKSSTHVLALKQCTRYTTHVLAIKQRTR